MLKVFVIDKNKTPLMPCSSARARQLLNQSKAKVFRFYPFTIILIDREGEGFYVGRFAVRTSGNVNIQTQTSTVQGINYRFCKILQRCDGSAYGFKPWQLPPSAKAEGIRRLAN